MTLRELEPGDIFRHAKGSRKRQEKFIVYGNPEFNGRHGSATRWCRLPSGEMRSKSCRLEVIKTGESLHKAKLMEQFKPQKKTS